MNKLYVAIKKKKIFSLFFFSGYQHTKKYDLEIAYNTINRINRYLKFLRSSVPMKLKNCV